MPTGLTAVPTGSSLTLMTIGVGICCCWSDAWEANRDGMSDGDAGADVAEDADVAFDVGSAELYPILALAAW